MNEMLGGHDGYHDRRHPATAQPRHTPLGTVTKLFISTVSCYNRVAEQRRYDCSNPEEDMAIRADKVGASTHALRHSI
jgi:uncharacterized protein YfaQ (DUF2300 family)